MRIRLQGEQGREWSEVLRAREGGGREGPGPGLHLHPPETASRHTPTLARYDRAYRGCSVSLFLVSDFVCSLPSLPSSLQTTPTCIPCQSSSMSSSTKKSIRFSQTTNKNTQKTLRRSSSFVKNLPRKTLNSKPLPSLESSSSSRGNQEQKHVWIEDEQQKWILCQLLRQEGPSILLKNLQTNQVFTFDSSFKEIFPHDPNVTSDMVTLRGLSEPSILNNLKERSFSKQPYTYMGTILISVNPFEWYDFPEIEQFKGRFMNPTTPHPYAIAGNSFPSEQPVNRSFSFLSSFLRAFLSTNLLHSCSGSCCCDLW